jgi:hypothetical protein
MINKDDDRKHGYTSASQRRPMTPNAFANRQARCESLTDKQSEGIILNTKKQRAGNAARTEATRRIA